MKRLNLYLLGSLFILPIAAFCQPTITNVLNPVNGTIIKTAIADTAGINEGPAGANKTYDFTNIKIKGTAGTYKYEAASGTPYASEFPNANLAFASTSTGGTDGFTYFKTTSNDIQQMGIATPQVQMVYSDPQLVYKYPMTMSSTGTDYFKGSADQTMAITYRYGTTDYLADGYGTLKLPGGTFNNVLRVKIMQHFFDSSVIFDDYILTEYIITTYNFLSNDYKQQLLGISYTTTEDVFGDWVTTKFVNYYPDAAGVNDISKNSNFNIYPNPAVNSFSIELPVQNLQNIRIELTDIAGRVITSNSEYEISGNIATMNTSNIPDGIYFVNLYSDLQRLGSKKISVAHN